MVVGVAIGIVMGWRVRVGYALDPLMTVFYASPLVALAPLVVVFFGVGVSGKAIIIFLLAVFPFIFNAAAGVRAVDRLLINVVRSLGGSEKDLYLKVIVPSVLPYIVAGARIAIGRALVGVLVGEFFAASEGIGYAIARFGDLFALDKMFACILVIMIIAVILTEGIRWAERAAFPWRVGRGRAAMSELQTVDATIGGIAHGRTISSAPPKSLWQRLEPTCSGVGSIVALLVVWEVLPHLSRCPRAPSCSSPRRARSSARCGTCLRPARSGSRSASAPPASRSGSGLRSWSGCRSAC